MQTSSRLATGAMLSLAATGALLAALAQPAQAATLSGGWAPFTRCAVNDPLVTAIDGVTTQPGCVVNDSTNGTLQLGTMGAIQLGPIGLGNGTTTAGRSNLQIAAALPPDLGATNAVAALPSGAVLADPANVAGGLLGLLCPDGSSAVAAICGQITNNALNTVTATLESAGVPRQFSLINALQLNAPVLELPVKIHLQHPLLGPNCYIGSNQTPILLHPQFQAQGFPISSAYNLDGSANDANGLLNRFQIPDAVLVDDTFSVPTASGCGLGDPLTAALINSVVNIKQGLPAPSGRNHLVLKNVTVSLMLPSGLGTVTGQDFANGYNSAVIAP